jgi:uncharacterized membrane protein YozB (DUF420 family)
LNNLFCVSAWIWNEDQEEPEMTLTQKQWLIPAGLIGLALVPVVAGAARLGSLSGTEVTAENARFMADPVPVAIHIIGASYFALVGSLQFVPTLRRRKRWHRTSGRLLVPAGLAGALSGIWMTLVYPWANADGEAVYLARLVFGSAMLVSLVLGTIAILRRDVQAHRAWMLRGYAIGMGAGTQVLTHLPYFILIGQPSEGPRAVMMIGAWAINLALAEWLIARNRPRPLPLRTVQPAEHVAASPVNRLGWGLYFT